MHFWLMLSLICNKASSVCNNVTSVKTGFIDDRDEWWYRNRLHLKTLVVCRLTVFYGKAVTWKDNSQLYWFPTTSRQSSVIDSSVIPLILADYMSWKPVLVSYFTRNNTPKKKKTFLTNWGILYINGYVSCRKEQSSGLVIGSPYLLLLFRMQRWHRWVWNTNSWFPKHTAFFSRSCEEVPIHLQWRTPVGHFPRLVLFLVYDDIHLHL